MSNPTTPPKPEGALARFKSFRSPTRAFTLTSPARPASPTATGPNGRPVPSRSSTRDSSNGSTTAKSRTSILTSPFQSRKSGLAPSTAASSDAVHEIDPTPKTEAPAVVTSEPATEEPAKDEPKDEQPKPVENVLGHARVRSGSTISTRSSQGPLTPPLPSQVAEPMVMPGKPDADPATDAPHDGASIASSRSPSRLRRQVSNLSRHSISGSIRRLSLLGPATTSPPQVETAPVIGEMETRSRSPSISSVRRHATSPDPTTANDTAAKSPEPIMFEELVAPQTTEPAPQAAEAAVEPAVEAPAVEAPQAAAPQDEVVAPTEAPQVEAPQVEALVAEPQVASPPAQVPTEAPAEAPQQEAPKAPEPVTPVKSKLSMSRNASTSSLTKTPGSEKPEPKRRNTLTNWARRSIDRKPSGTGPSLVRSPSRGALSGDDVSDAESSKDRERGWNTGRPVPAPKKSDDNIRRRFGLGRRPSDSGHAKTPSESASESDKKPNWAAKVLRVGSKSKKDRSDGASLGASSTAATSTVDVVPEPLSIPEPPRPSLAIPDTMSADQRPLSAIVESPIVPLNSHAMWNEAQPLAPAVLAASPLANDSSAIADSPVDVKPEDVVSSPELVEAEPEPPVEAAVEPAAEVAAEPVAPAPASPVLHEVAIPPTVEPLPTDADLTAQAAAVEPAAVPPPTEEVEPAVTEEAQPKATEPVVPGTPAGPGSASGASTPARVQTAGIASPPPQNLLSPMSPNSPASTPWDPSSVRDIARARSPRSTSIGGPSNRSRVPSPAASIIGVKRKQPDEPDVVKGRVRYLPDWAVSPAIQLAVTLSLVLPRRRRDAANPTNRRRGWWPMSRGPRTELRYNAIRGVNEEVPIVSRSWTVPAAVRTTAKVVTAPARWMFHLFVPRSSAQ